MAAEHDWTVEEAGAKGGRATLEAHGRGHFVEAGRKGGRPKGKRGEKGILFALAVSPEQFAWLEKRARKPQDAVRALIENAMLGEAT